MKEFASHSPTVALAQDTHSLTNLGSSSSYSRSTTSTKSNASSVGPTEKSMTSTQTTAVPSLSTASSSSNSSSVTTNQTSSTSNSSGNSGYAPLTAGVNFVYSTRGSDNSVQVTVGINDSGGLAPFTFIARWSDGINQTAYWNAGPGQTNGDGVFIRSFVSNQTIPTSVDVQVMSSDGQSKTVNVNVPPVSPNTSTGAIQPATMAAALPSDKQVIDPFELVSLIAFPLVFTSHLFAAAKILFTPH
jgi:hypothetical protein